MATALRDTLQVIGELGADLECAGCVERILSLLVDDGVWEASWGARYVGKEELRRGLMELFSNVPDVRFVDAKRVACGERRRIGVSRRVVGTRPDGSKIDEQGCDVCPRKPRPRRSPVRCSRRLRTETWLTRPPLI